MSAQPKELFKAQHRSGHGRGTAVSVRLPEPLLERIAFYGNANGLMLSDTVRALLEVGLDHAK